MVQTEIANLLPGVWRIRLPFHAELNHVNVHLLKQGEAFVLVDCGFGSSAAFQVLEASLTQLGVEWKHIREIVLTHGHPDHMGLAGRILDLSGARLAMHPREVNFLARVADASAQPQLLDSKLRDWGAPLQQVDRVIDAYLGVRAEFRHLTPDRALMDGALIESDAGIWEAIHTPGHSPGHVCLFNPEQRTLISGDHVLGKITPHIAWSEESDLLEEFLASQQSIGRLAADSVLPSHGDPFGGLSSRTTEIVEHHELRCRLIQRAQDEGARTAHDITRVLWRDELSPFQYRFAMYEVMAHLKYMDSGNFLRRRA